MSEKCGVSRRDSLKGLGAMGAAMVLGGPAAAASRTVELGSARSDQDKQAANVVDLAITRFSKGHNCAGAVCSVFAEQMGIDDQTAVKLTTGFGGGMYLGSTCGAVTGGIMAIGLKYGGTASGASSQTARLVREFADRFKAKHRSINCPDLTGIDLSKPEVFKTLIGADLTKPEGLKAVQDALGGRDVKTVFAACQGYVRDATTIVNELLNDAPR